MSRLLRIELIALAVIFIVIVFWTVNHRKLQMRFSLVWLLISFAMILVAFIPQFVVWLTPLVGIETPSNFIFLMAIIALLIICFFLTVHLSQQAEKIKRLTQIASIEAYLHEEQDLTQLEYKR